MEKRVFVAQPFHDPYNRRFDDTYKPAIERLGFMAYRVDRDPAVSIPIDDIESGIENSEFMFADISEDNPNVWFEVGYAIALKKEICFVCSSERVEKNKKFPFDIQHRSIIEYTNASARDWTDLEEKIEARIKGIQKKISMNAEIRQAIRQNVTSNDDTKLLEFELAGLASIASAFPSEDGISAYNFQVEMSSAGYNELASNMAIRRLLKEDLVSREQVHYENEPEPHTRFFATPFAWEFIDRNKTLFVLENKPNKKTLDDEIPF